MFNKKKMYVYNILHNIKQIDNNIISIDRFILTVYLEYLHLVLEGKSMLVSLIEHK